MGHNVKENDLKYGWLCSYTPIEIIMAAGLVPSRLDAGNLLIQKPNPNIYQLICPYIRAVFDAAQEEVFGPLDGVVFMKCCDAMLRLHDLWKAHLPDQKSYILPLPKVQTPEAKEYFAESIKRFAENLTRDTGTAITDESLSQAIRETNQLRSSVQELYNKRLNNPNTISYSRLQRGIHEWLSMHPVQALPVVEKELKAFNEQTDSAKLDSKVLISSSTLDQIEIIEMIEEVGMTIVGDDLCSGLRHFDEMVSEEGDPYLNLADRYLNRWPCPRMQAETNHIQRLVQEVENSDADGIIYVGLKYCDQSGYDIPRLQSRLKERNLPLLYIENDYTASGMGQLKVRIEAFAEVLKEEF